MFGGGKVREDDFGAMKGTEGGKFGAMPVSKDHLRSVTMEGVERDHHATRGGKVARGIEEDHYTTGGLKISASPMELPHDGKSIPKGKDKSSLFGGFALILVFLAVVQFYSGREKKKQTEKSV